MESRIYISQGGNSFGPYTESQCIQMLQSGLMSPNDLACRHGMNHWLPLTEIMPGAVKAHPNAYGGHPSALSGVSAFTPAEESVGKVIGQMAFGCFVWLGVLGFAIGGGVIFPFLLILAPIAIIGGAIDLIGKLIRAIRR
jgi:hypothetical protein